MSDDFEIPPLAQESIDILSGEWNYVGRYGGERGGEQLPDSRFIEILRTLFMRLPWLQAIGWQLTDTKFRVRLDEAPMMRPPLSPSELAGLRHDLTALCAKFRARRLGVELEIVA